MIRAALIFVLLLLPGFAVAGEEHPARVPAAARVMEGRLLTVRGAAGSEAQLTDRKGDRYLLLGRWQPELLRLDGHLVKVWGAPGGKRLMTPAISVARYAILDTGGGAPRVGRLTVAGDDLTLTPQDGGDPVRLTGGRSMLRKLRKRAGCKIWVVARWSRKGKEKGKGKPAAARVRVRVFGWLSCQEAAASPATKSSTGKPGAPPPVPGKP